MIYIKKNLSPLKNLKMYLQETTKSTATPEGAQIPFAHYVKQTFGIFPLSYFRDHWLFIFQ